MRWLAFSSLFLVLGLSSPAEAFQRSSCQRLFENSALILAEGERNAILQFGFETEYTLDQTGPLLEVYRPQEVSEADWAAMKSEARVAWVQTHYARRPAFAETTSLQKIAKDSELDFLPDRLLLDSTGNLEIVLSPVDSMDTLFQRAHIINSRFGAGSMQAMVSTTRASFFGQATGKKRLEAVRENLGFVTFMADLDSLQKLELGLERWKKDPTKNVARSFFHPWLGPLTEVRQSYMTVHLENQSKGNLFDPQTLKHVAKSDDSYKYISGTAYRPDIGGALRVAFEVRDAHNDLSILMERVQRVSHYLAEGRAEFGRFSRVKALDTESDFTKLPIEVQKMLEGLFPTRLKTGLGYTQSELLALQVHRNFAYPLKDWFGYVFHLRQPSMENTVRTAQASYLRKLVQIQKARESKKISDEQSRIQIQGALVEFVEESGLLSVLRSWEQSIRKKTKAGQNAA